LPIGFGLTFAGKVKVGAVDDAYFHGCKVTGLQSYRVSKLQSYRVIKFQDYKVSGLQDYKVSGLQDYKVSGLQDYKVSGLQVAECFAILSRRVSEVLEI
jgi:hypothetical protein